MSQLIIYKLGRMGDVWVATDESKGIAVFGASQEDAMMALMSAWRSHKLAAAAQS